MVFAQHIRNKRADGAIVCTGVEEREPSAKEFQYMSRRQGWFCWVVGCAVRLSDNVADRVNMMAVVAVRSTRLQFHAIRQSSNPPIPSEFLKSRVGQ